jgi:hypothetical protein
MISDNQASFCCFLALLLASADIMATFLSAHSLSSLYAAD